MSDLKTYIQNVPDFPQPGVMFRDIAPLLREHFSKAVEAMADLYTEEEWKKIDYVAGIESRGFILAAGIAALKRKGVVIIRKPGKLPGKTAKVSYGLEYGRDALEMHYGKGSVLIVDDVLATGGTLKAAADLATETQHQVMGFALLLDLKYLNNFSWNGIKPRCVLTYES